ncbi:MAG TPA: electron transfer flavoprotein subunit alpha/FixB family protein [Acidimicrobiia bacterium]|nr:electron transfer flavoprotein subunit alpha/FixB family protein [Acidimicrobiia bacterium]
MSRVLVYLETGEGGVEETSLQALALAASLGEPEAVTVGPTVVGGVDRHWQIDHEMLTDYAPEAIGEALAQLVGQEMPAAMLAAGSERGNEVMAHLSALLDLPLAANVIAVKPAGEDWELTRVRWGGSLFEEARLSAFVKLATVAPHAIEARPLEAGSSLVRVTTFHPELPEELARTRVAERVTVSEGITLTTAPVVVSGGRGVGSPEGFAILEELAGLLGGAVGCSRVVTNNGWRPHSDQVGQTGTRVAPNLYIACGISGAIQHWVGMMASKSVLAINTDPESPMVTKADYAVIGDLHPILEAVVAEVQRRRA